MKRNSSIVFSVALAVLCIGLSNCAPKRHQGFLRDPITGIEYGSVVERNIFVDSSQFEDRTMKVTMRNVSGDSNYELGHFRTRVEDSFRNKGYVPIQSGDFGIRLDLNVLYSGHVQEDMAAEYGFLGAAAGGIVGYRSDADAGTAIGVLSGATLGSIVGSYVRKDTYIMVAEVSIGCSRPEAYKHEKKVTSGSSPKLQPDYEDTSIRGFSPFAEVLRTRLAVFAG